MAKPLPNEQELYQRIKDENIGIHPLIWDAMYHYLGDDITAINLIVSYYIDMNQPVSIEDARKILDYTNHIKETVQKILHPEKIKEEKGHLERVKNDHLVLHPVVKEFFTHYIGNDTNIINLCVSFYLDPMDEQPVPVEDAAKVRAHTLTMSRFLDRLREATDRDRGY